MRKEYHQGLKDEKVNCIRMLWKHQSSLEQELRETKNEEYLVKVRAKLELLKFIIDDIENLRHRMLP